MARGQGTASADATVIDLFAGCGGLTSGFAAEGFDSLLAVEWDLHAAATYAANFGEDHVRPADIAAVESRDVPEADAVVGGPPCQGFSNLGSKDPEDDRNKLWEEYVRVVLAANPQVFVLENVDRFSRSPEFRLLMDELTHGRLRRWKHRDWAVLNAAHYGVPQRRQRTILMASRVGPIELPEATHGKQGADSRMPWTTVRDAIAHVPTDVTTTSLPSATVEAFGETVPGIFKSADLHVGRNPRPTSLERYDCIPPGGGRFDLPPGLTPRCWANKPTGTTDVMGRMQWDCPSLTIRTEFFKPEKGQYLHPQWDAEDSNERVNRPITHREAALLQTFPSDFLWCGTKIQIAKQIGNAVPPTLARVLARTVLSRLR
jgi:DNA (cytosine-5)-methyltransferase 1